MPGDLFIWYVILLEGATFAVLFVAFAFTRLRHPALLICDEATSALDVSVQKEIVDLLKEIQQEEHMAMLFISHDLALVANVCDRILMLSDGEIKKIKCVPDEAQ